MKKLILLPWQLLLITLVLIFGAEFLIMAIFYQDSAFKAAMDALFLCLVSLPILYIFLFKPLTRNILELKRQEEYLREEENFSKSFFLSIQDGIAIIDNNFTIIQTNTVLENWFVKFSPLVGKKCYEVYMGLDNKCVPCTCYDKAKVDETGVYIQPMLDEADEEIGWLEHLIFPLRDVKTNLVTGLIVSTRDISEKQKIQHEMERLESMHLVGEIAASIGHEVRNPMTTVRGFLQLMQTNNSIIKNPDILKLMIEELDTANMIISEFLSLAKNRTVQLETINLNSVLKSMLPLLQAKAYVNGKVIMVSMNNITPLLLDEKEMRQLILNLVMNGLEAMDPGGILEIETFQKANKVVLAFKDQGKGVEPSIKNKIGTPFLTTKEQGTGLGLAVCYSIAARHNAKIEFKSSKKGTTFFVCFSCPNN